MISREQRKEETHSHPLFLAGKYTKQSEKQQGRQGLIGKRVFIFVASLAGLKPQAEGGVESEESRKAEQCITVTDLLCHGTPEEL